MTISVDILITILVSALSGAGAAFFGNRVVQRELFMHVKRHCKEIERLATVADELREEGDAHKTDLALLTFRLNQYDRRRYRVFGDEDEK